MQQTQEKQSAKLVGEGEYNGTNHGGVKETTERKVLVVMDPDGEGLAQVVDARWYMGRSRSSSVVYCTVWIRTRTGSGRSGSGRAGGYGYCKSSAAFGAALDAAGVKLALDVDGRGMSAVEAAMDAIADAAGYGDCKLRGVV